MLYTLTLLLLYQTVGELVSSGLALSIPGPVIGMVLLLLTLLAKGEKLDKNMRANTAALLRHLSLLFIPAGVGIMLHLDRIGKEWLPITLALIISTFAGMAVTAWVIVAMTRKQAAGKTLGNGHPSKKPGKPVAPRPCLR